MSRSTVSFLLPILIAGLMLTACTTAPADIVGDFKNTMSGALKTGREVTDTVRTTIEEVDSKIEKVKQGVEKVQEGKKLLQEAVQ